MQNSQPSQHRDMVRAAIQAMQGTLTVADALLRHGRAIDLAGLDQEVVRICAAALALPAEDGSALRDDLALLLDQTVGLEAQLRR